jgi:LPS sulfotransferase NodH
MSGKLRRWLADRMVRAGLQRGRRDYLRFLVLGWYRSGSNLLISSLGSHPDIVAYSELFAGPRIYWGTRVYSLPGEADLRIEREEDAARFLDRRVFRAYPRRIGAVGFKVFYPQISKGRFKGLDAALRGDESLRVIHLKRRNWLKLLLSGRVARETGRMGSASEDAARQAADRSEPVTLTAGECEKFFTNMEGWTREYDAWCDGRPTLELTYEELAGDPARELARVQDFLSVPVRSLSSPLVKQERRPLAEAIGG